MPLLVLLSSPTGRSTLLLLTAIVIVPGLASWYLARRTVRSYNVCFVGPPVLPSYQDALHYNFDQTAPDAVTDLYGTYRAFDGASYYYVKTPFDVTPACVFAGTCGWPSATSTGATFSPRSVRTAKLNWRARAKEFLERHSASFTPLSKKADSLSSRTVDNIDRHAYASDLSTSEIVWDRGGPNPLGKGSNRWCLTGHHLPDGTAKPTPASVKVCTDEVPSIVADPSAPPFFPELPLSPPPSGVWDHVTVRPPNNQVWSRGGDAYRVQVHCHMNRLNQHFADYAAHGGVREGPMDENRGVFRARNKWNPYDLPGTLILIAVQVVVLIYLREYDDDGHRVATEPRDVAVIYDRVAPPHSEIWRIILAPVSHLTYSHLAFDLWTLYWVGTELEEDFGTLPYLGLHVALWMMCPLVTLMFVRLQMRYGLGVEEGANPLMLRGKPFFLGYTPVLFAWTIVAALERPDIVPFPILGVSIPTVVLMSGFVKINAMPLVNLLLARFLAPQSSMISHVAGMLCGFAIHWNFPPYILLSPQIIIPMLMFFHLWFVLKVIPVHRADGRGVYDRVEADDAAGGTIEDVIGRIVTKPITLAERVLFPLLRIAMIVSSIVSVFAFDFGMSWSQLVCTALFHYGIQARLADEERGRGGRGTYPILRGYFATGAIVVAMDSMAAGSWAILHLFITSDPTIICPAALVGVLIMARLGVNLLGLVVAASVLQKHPDNVTGLFGLVFANAVFLGDEVLAHVTRKKQGESTPPATSVDCASPVFGDTEMISQNGSLAQITSL